MTTESMSAVYGDTSRGERICDAYASARRPWTLCADSSTTPHARRLHRLTRPQQRDAVELLDDLWTQLHLIDVDEALVHRAGALADLHSLRGYDSTHCAGAESIKDTDAVPASGERQLLGAWQALGLNTLDVNAEPRNT